MIDKFSELAMGIDSVIMDVAEEWGDDIFPQIGNANVNSIGDVRAITIVSYCSAQYALFEDGSIYRVTSESFADEVTWNGDDNYVKAFKNEWTIHEKIGAIEIEDLDYSDDENIENVVCQLIEALRDL